MKREQDPAIQVFAIKASNFIPYSDGQYRQQTSNWHHPGGKTDAFRRIAFILPAAGHKTTAAAEILYEKNEVCPKSIDC